MDLHPPKPRLTMRVGITGHRPDKLHGRAAARIEEQFPDVFAAIETAAADILRANVAVYASAPPLIRLISGFAEGADQMAVAACPPNWVIEAILPFPKEEYILDFTRSAGDGRDVTAEFEASLRRASVVTELPVLHSQDRDLGYADAGGYLLRQIDLLIAVWDGKPPKTGGTGAIAREAFDGRIPVVWLSTDDKHGPRAAAATEDKHWPRLITGFDGNGAPQASGLDCTKGALTAVLTSIFAAPASVRDKNTAGRAGLEAFYAEEWHPRCRFTAYDILKRLANRQKLRFVIRSPSFEEHAKIWDDFMQDVPAAEPLRARLNEVLLPRFVWADALAVHFSHGYRSTYVAAYALSAAAVFIALFGIFSDSINLKAMLVLVELVVIGAIITIVSRGQKQRWHERWLEYRAVAESLRHGRYLAFVSEFGAIHDATLPRAQRESSWMLWYIRATMREIGVPDGKLDAAYQRRILDATQKDEIDKQLEYHRGNSQSANRIDRFLHNFGNYCFMVTLGMLGFFLIAFFIKVGLDIALPEERLISAWLDHGLHIYKLWMILAAAGLPALGAALAGIRVQGDFEESSDRSNHMLDELAALKADYKTASSCDLGLSATGALLISTARTMSEDLAAWQQLYGRKRLALPA